MQQDYDMSSIEGFMSVDHRKCDESYASMEESIVRQSWDEASSRFSDFNALLQLHLSAEEEVMFPAFEEVTGMTQGPTQVMRMEHTQMRGSLDQIAESIEKQNYSRLTGLLETLMILMQQHNMKEEQMLYRMADEAFGDRKSEVLKKMSAALSKD